MFNKIILVGYLTRDIEIRHSNTGSNISILGVASNTKFKKQDGTIVEDVCFIDVKFFGKNADIASQFLKKGSKVLIEGRLAYETWTDNENKKKSKHSIFGEKLLFMDNKSKNDNDKGYNSSYENEKYQTPKTYSKSKSEDIPIIEIDEDIPF